MSPRLKIHDHPCADCARLTPCDGTLEENHDGWPEVVCVEFHMPNGYLNPDFICEDCDEKRTQAARAEHEATHGV